MRVAQVTAQNDGFVLQSAAEPLWARGLILTAGIPDRLPLMPDALAQIKAGLIRQGPVGDAFEVRGRRIAVIGTQPCAVGAAPFLRHYTKDVTLVTLGARFSPRRTSWRN